MKTVKIYKLYANNYLGKEILISQFVFKDKLKWFNKELISKLECIRINITLANYFN